MRSQQRKSRQPPKANKQNASSTVWPLLLQGSRRANNDSNPYWHRCGNRHGYGNSGRRQTTRLPIPCQLHPIIPHGMRQSTSSTQQHHTTIGSRRSPDSMSTNKSKQDGRQHHRPTIANIQLTSTGQRWAFPSNTDGTNQNTKSPITTKLRQNNRQQTPNCTMAGATHRVSTQPLRNTCGWQHQLLPQMEQRPQSTTLWVWWNSTIPTTNSQATSKDGTTFLQSYLAWKRHSNRRNTPGH